MKRCFFLLLCAGISFFAAACGHSISQSQAFKPNQGPVITDIQYTFPAGVTAETLVNTMAVGITVTAHDPEGKDLVFTFASEAGNVGNITNTPTGCTAQLITTSVISGREVRVSVTARDAKGAVEARKDQLIGSGRMGAEVRIDTAAAAAIMPTADTGFIFHSNIDGYYQIVCSAVQPTGADESLPIYMYTASSDASAPKKITASIAGFSSTSNAKVRLTSASDGDYRVWIVFWDSFRQYTIKDMTVTQDGTAPGIVKISPSGTDQGVLSNIDVIFNEPVEANTSDFAITNSGGDALSEFNAPTAVNNSIQFKPKSELGYFENYTVTVKAGAKVKDRAGNELTLSAAQSGSFETTAHGTLSIPAIQTAGGTAVVNDSVFDYNAAGEKIKAVYPGTESDVHISYTTDGSAPSAAYTSLPSAEISFSKNTRVQAVAYKKGYKPSGLTDVTVRMKTRTPEAADIAYTNGTPYPSDDKIFYSSSAITFAKSSGTGYYLTASATDGTNPAVPAAEPTASDTTAPQLGIDNQRIVFKVRAQDANMEMSDSLTSPIYRRRDLLRPATTTTIPVSGYSGTPSWKKISMSASGQYIAAIETSSGGSGKGSLWVSNDYGVTWTENKPNGSAQAWSSCYVAPSLDAAADGKYMIATETSSFNNTVGKIWGSSNSGTTWSSYNLGLQTVWLSSFISNTGLTYYTSASSSIFKYTGGTYTQPLTFSAIANAISFSADGSKGIWVSASGYRYFDGATWASTTGTNSWKAAACSGDATLFAAIPSTSGSVYSGNPSTPLSSLTVPGTKNWSDVAVSYNANFIIAANSSYLSCNTTAGSFAGFNNVLSPDASTHNWSSVSINGTGAFAAATETAGNIWCANPGSTWTWYNQNMRNWTDIDCSADGQIIVACDGGYGHGGYLFTSTNGGETFTLRKDLGLKQWRSVSVSEDGTFAAAITDADCFLSVDSGATWAGKTPSHDASIHFTKVAVSNPATASPARAVILSDSSYRFFIDSTGNTVTGNGSNSGSGTFLFTEVVISADGKSFIMIAPDKITKVYSNGGLSDTSYSLSGFSYGSNFWAGIAANSDLSIVYIARYRSDLSGYLIDKGFGVFSYGINSAAISGAHLSSFSTSNDGKILNLSNGISYIYSSTDSGSTWIPQTAVGSSNWNCLAATSDGLTVFAGAAGAQNITVIK